MPDHRTENSTGISAPGFQKRKYEVENMKLKIQLRRLHRSLTARQLERAKKLWDRIGRFIETERKSSQWVDRFCYDHQRPANHVTDEPHHAPGIVPQTNVKKLIGRSFRCRKYPSRVGSVNMPRFDANHFLGPTPRLPTDRQQIFELLIFR